MMASIYYVGTYAPITCGIADYTSFITRESPTDKWGVLSFDLNRYYDRLTDNGHQETDRIWYGLPDPFDIGAHMVQRGLKELNARNCESVLWFQHETAIWPHPDRFVTMLKDLEIPKIVTFHTLHFQSDESPTGLRRYQYNLLRYLLPQVEAITVFSSGVHYAVTSAFPEYSAKIHLIKHGIHSFPEVVRLSRSEAKEKLNDFLLYESDLDQATKENLYRQGIFLDRKAVIAGQTGFVCPHKQSESLYIVRDQLQRMLPHKRLVAVRIGSSRDNAQKTYANTLFDAQDGESKFFLETLLPLHMLPVAQRAFDVNFYWPSECTQSGILAHALGAGAIVAARDLEGVGETLKDAGQLVDTNLEHLARKIRDLILSPEASEIMQEQALEYATAHSWSKQVYKHYELAERLVHPLSLPVAIYPSFTVDTQLVNKTFALENSGKDLAMASEHQSIGTN